MAIPDVPSMKENRNNNATIVPADSYDRQARELLRLKGYILKVALLPAPPHHLQEALLQSRLHPSDSKFL